MAVAWCINAYDCSWILIRTLEQLQSSNIGVWVQYTAPNPLDDKKIDYIKYTDKCWNTCCLTWENEILIYATNWVIKNLTLTNDDTNEAVVVKWNDIFWSNRAKTVVRYKTGSAPVSPTDWTLAVEETTKNQYSTNWFSVTGLSDSTTYYFSVFALDIDGTMIDVQSSSITTDFGRKPSANTLLYMPLNWNAKDEVSWTNWTRRWTATYVTLASWLKVAHINYSHNMITPTIAMDTEMTVAWWLLNNSWDVFFRADRSWTPRSFYQLQVNSSKLGWWWFWLTWTWYWWNGWVSSNWWFFCVIVCWNNSIKVYSNWTLVYEWTWINFAWRTQWWWLWYDQSSSSSVNADWYFSNLIIEKKKRTLTDITKMFNKTKAQYGL